VLVLVMLLRLLLSELVLVFFNTCGNVGVLV